MNIVYRTLGVYPHESQDFLFALFLIDNKHKLLSNMCGIVHFFFLKEADKVCHFLDR